MAVSTERGGLHAGSTKLAERDVAADHELVAVPGVVALSSDGTLLCAVRGRRVGIPFATIHAESLVRQPGDRGTLVLQAGVARRLGLVT